MSMRSQVYAWSGNAFGTAPAANQFTAANGGVQISVFIGGFGNNITMPAETTATEFVVIEDIACTPSIGTNTGAAGALDATAEQLSLWLQNAGETSVGGSRGYVQVRINTTDYFLNPDNVTNDGVPGQASPYPRSLAYQPSFNLYPDVYVLPGQVWDIRYTSYQSSANQWGTAATAANGGSHNVFTKYTLYDGPDALIANKLLEMGISINPGNVDWYKRSLLSAQ